MFQFSKSSWYIKFGVMVFLAGIALFSIFYVHAFYTGARSKVATTTLPAQTPQSPSAPTPSSSTTPTTSVDAVPSDFNFDYSYEWGGEINTFAGTFTKFEGYGVSSTTVAFHLSRADMESAYEAMKQA